MKRTLIVLLVFALPFLAAIAHAQVTSLSLTGDPGDFILGNQTKFLTPASGTFNVSQNGNSVSVSFFGSINNFSEFWFLDFAAPNGQLLTVGSYTEIGRAHV